MGKKEIRLNQIRIDIKKDFEKEFINKNKIPLFVFNDIMKGSMKYYKDFSEHLLDELCKKILKLENERDIMMHKMNKIELKYIKLKNKQ